MNIYLKPKKESVPVRKPDGNYLADTGENVTRNGFWIRRLNDGDVVECKSPSKTPAKTSSNTPAKTKAGE